LPERSVTYISKIEVKKPRKIKVKTTANEDF
jgi:hypothetical protein